MANKRLKIAFLSFYSGNVYRGVETFVHELANQLVSLGHDVTVFQGGKRLKGSNYNTVTINISTNWQAKSSYIPFINYFSRRIKIFTTKALQKIDSDTDIVFPTNGQWQSVLCKWWALLHGKKLVISGQSGPGIDDRINLFTFPNVFVSLTQFQKNWARGANPFVRGEKVPNGVNLSDFNLKVNPKKIHLPRPIILCVAALASWKRIDLAIKAVAKLGKGSLLIVGKGDQEAALEELGNKLLPDRFKIISAKHSQMPHIYRSADIFTFSTVPWESFGIVLVEAMAAGLPVVASKDPIRAEIVEDAGILVDPKNTDEYAKALEAALTKNWGNQPQKQAQKFSWEEIASQYEKIFYTICS